MPDYFEDVKPGQPIRADETNEVRRAVSGLLGIAPGDRLKTFRSPSINLSRSSYQGGNVMVRITQDVYPEGSQEFITAYGPFDPTIGPQDLRAGATTTVPTNAILQVYDRTFNVNGGPNGYVDDPNGQVYYVTTYGDLPIPQGAIIPIYYDRTVDRWLPAWEKLNELIRVSSLTLNGAGYYDGYIQKYDKDTQTASDGTQVHCRGINSETLALSTYEGRVVSHKAGRPLYYLTVGGGGGGSLTVKDIFAATTFTNVTELDLDSPGSTISDDWVVTNLGGGKLKIAHGGIIRSLLFYKYTCAGGNLTQKQATGTFENGLLKQWVDYA